MPQPRLAAPLPQRRPLSTLRLSQSSRNQLTNASFVAAAAFAVLTVSLGMQHLPCPARAPDAGGHKTLGMEGEQRWTPDEKGKGKAKRRWLDDPVAPGVPKRAFVAGQAAVLDKATIPIKPVQQEPERRSASRTPGVADGGEGSEGWVGWARKVTIGS